MKRRPLSSHNMDNKFPLTTDPLLFFSSTVLITANVLCLIATAVWYESRIPWIQFLWPAVKCENLPAAISDNSIALNERISPQDTRDKATRGIYFNSDAGSLHEANPNTDQHMFVNTKRITGRKLLLPHVEHFLCSVVLVQKRNPRDRHPKSATGLAS
ncbi:hypothetical protein B0J12DRAFT_203703 [Macrophomina phaseolina]|uniref:Uncharacterized protein n=1 Tax=Macrophomina phaseolina TaxID=35725 RepID=A0ABQ8G2I3_9PEZI|nr:hypothetical protein B0J12DRAFT_203703 [Macrophomina phaseolina]